MRATQLIALLLAFGGAAGAQDAAKTWDFQSDKVDEAPAGFSFGKTGQGRPGKWVVRVDPTAPAGDHVLAQVDTDDTDDRFPVAVADAPVVKDLRLEVRCKPISGKTDQACGLVFRYQDENNYYVTRANALEDNVRLYHVVEGKRRQFAGWNGKVASQTWHTLAVEARGDRLQVFFDGKSVIEAKDDTFKDTGKVGLWTKADSVTHFDALSVKALVAAASVTPSPLTLPGADGPVGFDDLRFSAELHKVLVPAGRTGRVDLVDPEKHSIEEIRGFSASGAAGRGHGESTTSADAGGGFIFASDRTQQAVVVVDPATKAIVARARLGGVPDYVRWVATTHEIWVTEPGKKVIETFRVDGKTPPTLTQSGTIEVPDGPESLEIDASHRRAYTNTWHDGTIAIDVESRAVVGRWKNGCSGSRGLALDAQRGLVFVGCDEGKAVVLDASHDGHLIGHAPTGDGVDIIAYGAKLSHLYVPGGGAADLTVIGVGSGGALDVLGKVPTAREAHCVTADDLGNVYVCDPGKGRLLTFRDPFPATH